ncbi:biopolymer transporter ExbD [Candidatus Tenderia electrophaga]|jgi:biopolymer transport protein ExbD|uniref:Biopolymer transporter ExbD n=1 Tax=Candidatus Tenderia electrophaga TaxID=1748243 RepID=A0A0S2TEF2_9GAMM|nr:biopolymer transporter ExbD [Candidatus Tenderia electrophaga]
MAFFDERDEDEVMSEINMTPLVDVMLVLLIIFMLTVPVLTRSLEVELPRASSSATETTPETVSVAVNAAGEVYWNDVLLTGPALTARLAAAAAETPQPQLHIRADRHTDYYHVVRVMAAARQAGLSRLGFVTEVDDAPG